MLTEVVVTGSIVPTEVKALPTPITVVGSDAIQQQHIGRFDEIIRLAVKRMMPRGPLAYKQITKLKIYAGPDHPHAAQKPEPLEVEA